MSWPNVDHFPWKPEVGQTYLKKVKLIHPKTKKTIWKNRSILFNYSNVKYRDGWADAETFLPERYALVALKILRDNKEFRKDINGWWTGKEWEALRMQKGDKVQFWRRLGHEEIA